MTESERISDELLNAYVDGELGPDDAERIEQAMAGDGRLRERVEELEHLKQMVRSAYVDEQSPSRLSSSPRRWNTAGLAASLMAFVLGAVVASGWFLYGERGVERQVASGPTGEVAEDAGSERRVKVIFHVNRNDPGRLSEILDETEALLMTTKRRGNTASVRIIASGAGLLLFEKGAAPEPHRVSQMQRQYQDQLVFNGCGVAYKQLKQQETDGRLELLPEVELVDLGVLELMRRQKQGWAYVRL